MTIRNDASRTPWSAPKLVQKPLEETLLGVGIINDGGHEVQS